MQVTAVKTDKITANYGSLIDVLDKFLPEVHENEIVVITSKIVSICEGSVVAKNDVDKEDLIVQEADWYLPANLSKYGYHFAITRNTLISVAGIDESNGEGYYILWPRDSQKTANEVRHYLQKKYGLKHVGVVITDSTCNPLRRGTVGISLAHSGFKSLRNYVGKPDLFGRPFQVSQANISGGLAASAVLVMGEGTEQTPICVLSDLNFVDFVDHDPTPAELAAITIEPEDDLFAPFLSAVEWRKGKHTEK